MANVTYVKTKTEPSGRKLIFRRQPDNSIISDTITLGFNILLNQLAKKPIARIQLIFEMLYPGLYEFKNEGSVFIKEFENVSADFQIPKIEFRIKILNPAATLEREVIFKVTVMDFKEKDPFPLGGNLGFYSWEPIPPPTGTFLNDIPNNLV